MKCLELSSDIAKSDKNCHCTCFKDPIKKKYFKNITKNWVVPTTSLPPWAINQLKLSTTGNDEDYEHGSLMHAKENTTNSGEEANSSNESKDSKESLQGSQENNTSTENKSSGEGGSSVETSSTEDSSTGAEGVIAQDGEIVDKGGAGVTTTEENEKE
ncbi:unnamed protein product [Arctia plantaginis]|uniref:Uncharacterized protein n=1 Tax=Arctia plantaginis TaxID=874455 RepID=A0A8S0ZCX9_ARCPL|nr:unnamed protein product [Arctia plantaginis]